MRSDSKKTIPTAPNGFISSFNIEGVRWRRCGGDPDHGTVRLASRYIVQRTHLRSRQGLRTLIDSRASIGGRSVRHDQRTCTASTPTRERSGSRRSAASHSSDAWWSARTSRPFGSPGAPHQSDPPWPGGPRRRSRCRPRRAGRSSGRGSLVGEICGHGRQYGDSAGRPLSSPATGVERVGSMHVASTPLVGAHGGSAHRFAPIS